MTKKGIIFETLGSTENLQIKESHNPGEMILSGVFGVCGIRNGNNRIYEKSNYGKMVGILKEQIMKEGVLGELEHPNTMNITLENVSHKIEDIVMNEDGTVTGTIKLLDTPKGKIAKAIIEGGAPLYISSRGAGSIDESGRVTLTTIKTYDLVGTPGFSQARMTLAENQTYEALNESLDTPCWMIVESEDADEDTTKKKDTTDQKDNDDSSSEEDITMKDIKDSVDALTKKVEQLESELHVTKEDLKATEATLEECKNKEINYEAVQMWIEEEFAPDMRQAVEETYEEKINGLKNYVNEEFSLGLQKWVTEEFSPILQNWINEEYTKAMQEDFAKKIAPAIQKWVTEDYSGTLQDWVIKEFGECLQDWVNKEYSETLHKWITEEFAGEMNKNISEYLESQKPSKFDNIDKMLEALSDKTKSAENAQKILEQQQSQKYAGIPAIENMPAHLRPLWEALSDDKKERIVRESRMYDFTKPGSLERFWESRQLTSETIMEDKHEQEQKQQPIVENKYSKIFAQAKAMRK